MYDNELQKTICFRPFLTSFLSLQTDCDDHRKSLPIDKEIEQKNVVPAMEHHEAGVTAPRRAVSQVESLQCPLPLFDFLEGEIEFVGVIGEGYQAIVFRIECGGKTYACKIHKYEDLQVDIGQYPRPNRSFDKEALTYAKATHLQGSAVPKCYGYVELSKIPQLENDQQENPYEADGNKVPPYMGFVNGQDILQTGYMQHSSNMLQYFKDAPAGACVLRGVVMEEIEDARSLTVKDLRNEKLGEFGLAMLKQLHKCGVIHHDLLNLENTLVVPRTEAQRTVFIDFSLAEFVEDFQTERWGEMVQSEVEEWLALFSNEYMNRPMGLGL